ncbi:DUF2141 domain-containing protein [Sphingomonas sp.]|uniref:DUF2141 domain-containing protein n=1 Tax=Sphingomonas sp. TaxID=28214 RepID=UPI0025F5B93D|nr:DUF2141 domain-containing protein [Sphingomonas sp.]
MSKSAVPLAIGGAALAAAATSHAAAQPVAASTGCAAGKPSVVVHVAGFKQPAGKVKVTLYGSDANLWLAKGGRISKVKVPVTARSMDICVPVPAPGRYALSVHHDLNVNGERDRQDGGGYSRDPKVSLFNPKPPYAKAAFTVGNGPSRVGVTLVYMRGLSVGRVGS